MQDVYTKHHRGRFKVPVSNDTINLSLYQTWSSAERATKAFIKW